MPELDKPPSYIDVENQDIPPTYEEAKLNELLQYMKYSYNIIDWCHISFSFVEEYLVNTIQKIRCKN